MYLWADGVYSQVHVDDKLCLLVLIGSDDTGRKEVLPVLARYRESEASRPEVMDQRASQGLSISPEVVIGIVGMNSALQASAQSVIL